MIIINCDNKGCMKSDFHLLDTKTNEVICTECGEVINNVTYFMKIQLKSLGQIVRDSGTKEAFSITCESCNKKNKPLVDKKGNIVCPVCNHIQENVPLPFANMLRTVIKAK